MICRDDITDRNDTRIIRGKTPSDICHNLTPLVLIVNKSSIPLSTHSTLHVYVLTEPRRGEW